MAKEFRSVALYWKSENEGSSTTLVAALDPALTGKFAKPPLISRLGIFRRKIVVQSEQKVKVKVEGGYSR